jgi:hypothetical protein
MNDLAANALVFLTGLLGLLLAWNVVIRPVVVYRQRSRIAELHAAASDLYHEAVEARDAGQKEAALMLLKLTEHVERVGPSISLSMVLLTPVPADGKTRAMRDMKLIFDGGDRCRTLFKRAALCAFALATANSPGTLAVLAAISGPLLLCLCVLTWCYAGLRRLDAFWSRVLAGIMAAPPGLERGQTA